MATNFTLQSFLTFAENLPFAQIGQAAAAGGLNVPLDFATAEAIFAAAIQDFFTGAPATTVAPATTAAITAATSPSRPTAG